VTLLIIKISGHELDGAEYLASLAEALTAIAESVVIVHGGGKEITQMQERMGITPQYADGVRITDSESLALVNKRLVRTLVNAGVQAIGLSGVDGAIVRAEKMTHPTADMGFTGSITWMNSDPVRALLGAGYTPVIAPISIGRESNFNVNADHVAGALATVMGADRLVFLSNVPGVLLNGAVVPTLTAAEADALIADGTIFGGMIPKVRTAIAAAQGGVRAAVITDLAGLRSRGGTAITG
jgi:acetylglutamate kinase